jgi:hypothetical protein
VKIFFSSFCIVRNIIETGLAVQGSGSYEMRIIVNYLYAKNPKLRQHVSSVEVMVGW